MERRSVMASSWEEGGVRRARWLWRATEESWGLQKCPAV